MREARNVPSNEAAELLSTKLAIPRARASLVPREELLVRLDAGLERKLTLISAPAGFGKTTLVSEWVGRMRNGEFGMRNESGDAAFRILPEGSPVHPALKKRFSAAWVSLDEGDNDPARFWRYLLTACRRFDEFVGEAALDLLRSPQLFSFDAPEQLAFEPLLTTFLNDLDRLSDRCVLVLEDYHVITTPAIHDSMAFLLDHLPEMVHIVILTRNEPPLPMARLRARGDILELRAADLRFSLEDTRSFLQRAMPALVTTELVARLQERTEGWPAGLNLMSLALQGRTDSQERKHFLDTFTGSYRHIEEYLVSDVLNAQPEPMQTFLLQTSGLSRLTAPLCDAITGRAGSETLLEELERANLFLIPLDGSGQWYRYHALFTEAMQHEARRRLGEDMLHACYTKASHWYEQHDLLTEAVEASLSARSYEHAARLIEKQADFQKFRQVFEFYTIARWLKELPEEVLQKYPRLCFDSAFLLSLEAETPEGNALAEARLQVAEQSFRAENDMVNLGGVYALRALRAVWKGEISPMVAYAKQALAYLPEDETIWKSSCFSFVGAEEALEGRLKAARQMLLKAIALSEATGNRYTTRPIKIQLARVFFGLGELHAAAGLYDQVIVEADIDKDYFDRGQALLGMAWLSYEWNQLDTAEQQAKEAFELCEHRIHLAEAALEISASMVWALVSHAKGQSKEALQKLASIPARTTPEQFRLLNREVLALQARLSLAAGDLSSAQRWAARREQNGDTIPFSQREQEDMTIAHLRLAEGKPQEAIALLETYRVSAHQDGRMRSALEIELLMAKARSALGQTSQATQSLLNALALTQSEGYRRIFLDEGAPIESLLQAAQSEAREQTVIACIHTLLQAFAAEKADPTSALQQQPAAEAPIEPLSIQEQRVLRLFTAGLSRQEIANELVVSVNTVKTHLQRIYRKLAVTSRSEARDAARRLKLQ